MIQIGLSQNGLHATMEVPDEQGKAFMKLRKELVSQDKSWECREMEILAMVRDELNAKKS